MSRALFPVLPAWTLPAVIMPSVVPISSYTPMLLRIARKKTENIRSSTSPYGQEIQSQESPLLGGVPGSSGGSFLGEVNMFVPGYMGSA